MFKTGFKRLCRKGDFILSTDVQKVLEERGSRYGTFKGHASIAQDLKRIMRSAPSYIKMDNSQVEAMEMIMHKIARILNGDPNYDDSWVDIAGYSKLIADELKGKVQ